MLVSDELVEALPDHGHWVYVGIGCGDQDDRGGDVDAGHLSLWRREGETASCSDRVVPDGSGPDDQGVAAAVDSDALAGMPQAYNPSGSRHV